MKRKAITTFICFAISFACIAQSKKLISIYTNFQANRKVSFMNSQDLGVSFTSKKEKVKLVFELNGYYPTYTFLNYNYGTTRYGDYNYNYYQELPSSNDTFKYLTEGLSNQGLGFSLGLVKEFVLLKLLKLQAGITVSNMVNFQNYHSQIVKKYSSGSVFDVSTHEDIEKNLQVQRVRYVLVLKSFLGAEFIMSKHIQLIPRINFNLAAYKHDVFFPHYYEGLVSKSSFLPSLTLGYKF